MTLVSHTTNIEAGEHLTRCRVKKKERPSCSIEAPFSHSLSGGRRFWQVGYVRRQVYLFQVDGGYATRRERTLCLQSTSKKGGRSYE
jgi:hypothetical protein